VETKNENEVLTPHFQSVFGVDMICLIYQNKNVNSIINYASYRRGSHQ